MSDKTDDRKGFPREMLISWGLNLATTIALSVGAFFFRGLTEQIDRLNVNLAKFEAKVAVLESSAVRQAALEAQVNAIAATVAAHGARLDVLERKDGR